MSGGLNRLLASAVVAGAILVLPPAALADCGGKPSAVNVYKECLPTGGGGKATGGGGKHTGGGSGTQTTSGYTNSAPTYVHISKRTAKVLKKAGKDEKPLSMLVKGYGATRVLQSSHSAVSAPTAVGSAFDLGSGPTVLLIVLAGTAVLLFAASGLRVARHRRG